MTDFCARIGQFLRDRRGVAIVDYAMAMGLAMLASRIASHHGMEISALISSVIG